VPDEGPEVLILLAELHDDVHIALGLVYLVDLDDVRVAVDHKIELFEDLELGADRFFEHIRPVLLFLAGNEDFALDLTQISLYNPDQLEKSF
jgi:hypothetical protein